MNIWARDELFKFDPPYELHYISSSISHIVIWQTWFEFSGYYPNTELPPPVIYDPIPEDYYYYNYLAPKSSKVTSALTKPKSTGPMLYYGLKVSFKMIITSESRTSG